MRNIAHYNKKRQPQESIYTPGVVIRLEILLLELRLSLLQLTLDYIH